MELKDVLSMWEVRKAEFDAKLVSREETGCCVYTEGTGSAECPMSK